MKPHITICCLLFLLTINGYGQSSPIKNRYTIKTSMSMNLYGRNLGFIDYFERTDKYYHIEGCYGINRFIEPGLYLGYSGNKSSANRVLYFGVQSNFHLLPIFIKADNFRFDVYSSVKLGACKNLPPYEKYYSNKIAYKTGTYGGLTFYPFKKLGLFSEYGKCWTYSEYGIFDVANFRLGLTYKF